MSVQEHIFISTDLDLEAVAGQLASLPGMVISHAADGRTFVSRPAGAGQAGDVGGEVSPNLFADPDADAENASLLDGFTVVWDIGCTGQDRELQFAEAKKIFLELTERFRGPLALIRGLDLLVAAYTRQAGVRWMPPGVTPDPEHRELWWPFAPTHQ